MQRRTLSIPAAHGASLAATEFSPDESVARDAPVVVLAHGWILSSDTWRPVVEEVLAHRSVRIVTYDQRGHGRSTWGTTFAPTIETLGEDLTAVIGATAPDGPLVLGGHSMGGMTVLGFAGAHPDIVHERVKGDLLVATAAAVTDRRGLPGESIAMALAARTPLLRTGMIVPTPLLRRLNFGEHAPTEGLRDGGRAMSRSSLQAFGRYYPLIRDLDETAAMEVLADIPTRILVGSKDQVTPARWSRALHDGIPDSRLTVLPGKGHMLTYEATDIVADQLIELIDQS